VKSAVAGPSFVTVMVMRNVSPAIAEAGADISNRRFAGSMTVVDPLMVCDGLTAFEEVSVADNGITVPGTAAGSTRRVAST
jgi:hypothetical protein